MIKKRKKEIGVGLLVYFTTTRNNCFLNILSFKGERLFQLSGGRVCQILGFPRKFKKSQETLRTLASYGYLFLRSLFFKRLGVILRGDSEFLNFFLKKAILKRTKISSVFIGKFGCFPVGGCRPSKERNGRSRLKLKKLKIMPHNTLNF